MRYGKISRRNALKLTAGSSVFVGLQGIIVGRSDRSRRVPRVVDTMGETISTMKVTKRWINHLRSIKRAKHEFDREYLGQSGLVRTSIAESDVKQGGRNGFHLKMVVRRGEYQGDRPEEYRGFDVVIDEVERSIEVGEDSCDCSSTSVETTDDGVDTPGGGGTIMSHEDTNDCYYNNDNWSTYLGGVPFWRESESDRSTDWFPKGTHSWLVEYQGNEYVQGARHSYVPCSDSSNVSGEEVYTHGYKIGDVIDWNDSVDAFVASTDAQDFVETTPQIINEDGTSAWPVGGIHSETSIASMILTDEQHTTIGTATGRSGGFVQEQYATSDTLACDFGGYGVVSEDTRVALGDSGGPVFTVEDGDAILISMRTHFTEEADPVRFSSCPHGTIRDESIGPAAHHLRDIGYKPVVN